MEHGAPTEPGFVCRIVLETRCSAGATKLFRFPRFPAGYWFATFGRPQNVMCPARFVFVAFNDFVYFYLLLIF